MNPGELNKRLNFDSFSIWGKRIIKNKKRQSGQNQEEYEFIIRNRIIDEYSFFTCNDIKYIVLTVDNDEPGYLKITCEKAKIHTFYDVCTILRMDDTVAPNGANRSELLKVYENIPCELVNLTSSNTNESQQENKMIQNYDLYVENDITIKVGDTIQVVHKNQSFDVTVLDSFKSHTHQIVSIKLDGEA